MTFFKTRIKKALIRLRGCTGWSVPVLFAKTRRQVFSRRGPCYTCNSWFYEEYRLCKKFLYFTNCCFYYLQCQFEDVLAEPEGTHSIDCVWKLSYTCFNLWKSLCYKLATLFYGICIAAEWGCEFAYISFYHIWFITPTFKWIDMNCSIFKRLWGQCVSCCCEPCCMTCGLFFHQFKK